MIVSMLLHSTYWQWEWRRKIKCCVIEFSGKLFLWPDLIDESWCLNWVHWWATGFKPPASCCVKDSDTGSNGWLKWDPVVWPLCSRTHITRVFLFETSPLGRSVWQRCLMCCFAPIKQPWQLSGQTHHASVLFISPRTLLCLLGPAVEGWQHNSFSFLCYLAVQEPNY